MAALLDLTRKAALENRKATLITIAGEIQTTLNELKTAKPENDKHAAFGELVRLHTIVIDGVAGAERALLANDNAYGK